MTAVTLLALLICAAGDVELDVGTQKILEVPAGAKVSTQKPAVVDVKLVGERQLLLIGVAAGTTSVQVMGADGKRKTYAVIVRPHDDANRMGELLALLPGIDGLVIVHGQCPRVDCDDCTRAQSDRVDQVNALFACSMMVHTFGGPRTAAAVLDRVKKILGEGPNDPPGMELEILGGKVSLSGQAFTAEDVRRVEQVREAFHEVRIRVKAPRSVKPDGG